MLTNLAMGSLMVMVTIGVHGVGLLALSAGLRAVIGRYNPHERLYSTVGVVIATVTALFALHTIEIWLWAAAYVATGAIADLHRALTFSTLSFSTLGAEDVSTTPYWRLFGSIEGIAGFLMIGWSTAYLIPAWTRYGPFHAERGF